MSILAHDFHANVHVEKKKREQELSIFYNKLSKRWNITRKGDKLYYNKTR
jgi:hypothetical protein